jgi:hypothetical protein
VFLLKYGNPMSAWLVNGRQSLILSRLGKYQLHVCLRNKLPVDTLGRPNLVVLHHHAAAGMNDLPGQPSRIVTHHESHHIGYVLRKPQALEGR